MTTTIYETIELTTVNCGKCGGSYAINARFHDQCREEGKSWHCPYCQVGWGFQGRSETSQLRDQLARERQRHDQTKADLRETEARRRAEKAATTRLKNRVASGFCPCCKRTFQNLARHMQNQHPDFTKDD